eukprot:2389951-Rhodomonas_salina.1
MWNLVQIACDSEPEQQLPADSDSDLRDEVPAEVPGRVAGACTHTSVRILRLVYCARAFFCSRLNLSGPQSLLHHGPQAPRHPDIVEHLPKRVRGTDCTYSVQIVECQSLAPKVCSPQAVLVSKRVCVRSSIQPQAC